MENFSTWEPILIGAIALLIVFWFGRGIKPAFERSRKAEANWPAVLTPLALVVLFVLFLILVS
ncbi:MAG: hypothetical protein PHE55_19940 [Methylococcaceae bacterium]|nr:hypothetical protein [Methylococcaceae bacterium]